MSRRSKGPRLEIYRREGRQSVYVIRDGTRSYSTGCAGDDVEGARERLRQYLEAHHRPDTGQRDLAKIPVSEVLMLYFQDTPQNSPSYENIKYSIQALSRFWKDKTLADVRGSTCRKYIDYRSGSGSSNRPVKPGTSRKELKFLQAAINHWHKESPLVAVPKVTLPPPGSRRERVLERNEVARMLWACRRLKLPHVARFILIGIYTGTRHDAILRLRWFAGLSGGHADIERGILFRRGSGEQETSKRRPPARLSERLRSHMAHWRNIDNENLSHIIHRHGQPLAHIHKPFRRVVKAAGLGTDVTPHVLRHTCASWLLWKGVPVWEVAGIIGATNDLVDNTYGHHRKVGNEERIRA